MENNEKIIAGLTLALLKEIELPENLRKFLQLDDQGIEGFEMMRKDEKLSKRIPRNVIIEYELFRGQLALEMEKQLNFLKNQVDECIKNPTPLVHIIIQDLLENDK